MKRSFPTRRSSDLGRLVGDVVDRAAGGILAEQNALRTFQYLNTLHVQTDPDAGQLVLLEEPNQLARIGVRSEEHTSELPSLMRNSYAVFCLKNKNTN